MYSLGSDVADIITSNHEGLVLFEERLCQLGPLAMQLVLACDQGPQSRDDLVALCMDVFGEPPSGDGAAIVDQALTDLVANGTLAETDQP